MTEKNITAREEAVAAIRLAAVERQHGADKYETMGAASIAQFHREAAALLDVAATMLEQRLDERTASRHPKVGTRNIVRIYDPSDLHELGPLLEGELLSLVYDDDERTLVVRMGLDR